MRVRSAFYLTLLTVSNLLGAPFHPSESIMESPIYSYGEGPRFYLDYANFKGTENRTLVEFYIDLEYNELQFIYKEGRFSANYDLDLFIYDKEDNVIKSFMNHDVFEVESYAETKSKEKARITPVSFLLEPRLYRLEASVTDLETGKTSKIEKFFFPRNFQSNNLLISDIQLCQKIEPGEPGQPCVKNHRYLEPNVHRTFVPNFNDLYIYFEVYNLEYSKEMTNSTYTAFFIFQNSMSEKIGQFHRQSFKLGTSCANILNIPVENFLSGQYSLTVRVRDDDNGQMAQSSKSFIIVNLPLSYHALYMKTSWDKQDKSLQPSKY